MGFATIELGSQLGQTVLGKSKNPLQLLVSRGDSSDEANGSVYSACCRASFRHRVDIVDADVIAVQGFAFDAVEVVGDTLTSKPASHQEEVLQRLASLATAMTITSSACASAPHLDGCYQAFQFESSATGIIVTNSNSGAAHGDFIVHCNSACTGRHLVTTRNKHTIGLGHANVRQGDIIAILLRLAVPFILRKSKDAGLCLTHSNMHCWIIGCAREKHQRYRIPVLYTIIGQALVRDCIWYQGDIEQDIAVIPQGSSGQRQTSENINASTDTSQKTTNDKAYSLFHFANLVCIRARHLSLS